MNTRMVVASRILIVMYELHSVFFPKILKLFALVTCNYIYFLDSGFPELSYLTLNQDLALNFD